MASKWYTVVVDSSDPAAIAKFWAAVLEYRVIYSAPDEVVIAKDEKTYPGLIFVPVPEGKTVKNRLHIDIGAPEVDAEVARLTALGATVVRKVSEHGMQWTVMLDPESNAFCVCKV